MTTTTGRRVAAEVRAELARRQMTQAQLAAAIGKHEMYISRRIGTSATLPLDVEDLAAIACALSVPVSQFMPDEISADAS